MPKLKNRKYAKITVEINGEKVRKSIGYRTLAEYEEKKQKILDEAKKENSVKLKKIAMQWKDEHDKTIQTYTTECYKAPLKDIIDEFGEVEITEITPKMIQSFLNDLASKKYAKQTVKLRKIVIKQIFDYAIFNNFCTYNPAIVCKIPKNTEQKMRELPDEEDITTILKNTDCEMGLYCALIIYTGMRREEALALSYEDFDLTNNLIHVHKTLIFEGNTGIIRQSTKSKSGDRYIPILEPLKKLIDKEKTGLIFQKDNRPMKKGEFDKAFNKYQKNTGISCTSHQLRHYFCTLCFDAGLDEKDLQDIMGHSKIAMSKDIYTHIRQQRKEDSANKLNAFVANF